MNDFCWDWFLTGFIGICLLVLLSMGNLFNLLHSESRRGKDTAYFIHCTHESLHCNNSWQFIPIILYIFKSFTEAGVFLQTHSNLLIKDMAHLLSRQVCWLETYFSVCTIDRYCPQLSISDILARDYCEEAKLTSKLL